MLTVKDEVHHTREIVLTFSKYDFYAELEQMIAAKLNLPAALIGKYGSIEITVNREGSPEYNFGYKMTFRASIPIEEAAKHMPAPVKASVRQ